MVNRLKAIAFAIGIGTLSIAQAESVLTYEITDENGNKSHEIISLTGRWVRVDYEKENSPHHIIMDAGYMRMHDVDDTEKKYQTTFTNWRYWSSAPDDPVLKPTDKKEIVTVTRVVDKKETEVALECTIVEEMGKDGPVMEHCMAGAAMGELSDRELKSMTRYFMSNRRRGAKHSYGVGTQDERIIALKSRRLDGKGQMELERIKHDYFPEGYFVVPGEYTQVLPNLPGDPHIKSTHNKYNVPARPGHITKEQAQAQEKQAEGQDKQE